MVEEAVDRWCADTSRQLLELEEVLADGRIISRETFDCYDPPPG